MCFNRFFEMESEIRSMKEHNEVMVISENAMILYESGKKKSAFKILIDKIKELCEKITDKIKRLFKAKILISKKVVDENRKIEVPDYVKMSKKLYEYQEEVNRCENEEKIRKISEKYKKQLAALKATTIIVTAGTFFGTTLSKIAKANEKLENQIRNIATKIADENERLDDMQGMKGFQNIRNELYASMYKDANNKDMTSVARFIQYDRKKWSIFRLRTNMEILEYSNYELNNIQARIKRYEMWTNEK